MTLQYDSHRGVCLCNMIHTAEYDSEILFTPQSLQSTVQYLYVYIATESKIFYLPCQRPRWVQILEKIKVENLVSHSLSRLDNAHHTRDLSLESTLRESAFY